MAYNALTGQFEASTGFVSVLASLLDQAASMFTIREEPTGELDEKERPVVRQCITELQDDDGLDGLQFAISVPSTTGTKKGSAKIVMDGGDLSDVTDALLEFDPNAAVVANDSNLPMAEIIRQTIHVEDVEGTEYVAFQTSLKSHARMVKIPVEEWGQVCEQLFSKLPAAADGWISYTRGVIEANEKAANKGK